MIAEKECTMDRISTLGNHKCPKGKIFPPVQPIIAVVLPWIPLREEAIHSTEKSVN